MTFFLRPQSLNYSHMNQLRCTCSDLRKVSPARRSCLQNERTHQSIKSSSLSWIHSLDLTSSNFRDLQKVNILLYLFLVRKISRLVSSLPSQYIYPIDADSQSSEKMMKTNHSTKSPLEPLQSFSSLASHCLKTTTMLCLRFSQKKISEI